MTDFLYPDILNEQLTYARQARAAWLWTNVAERSRIFLQVLDTLQPICASLARDSVQETGYGIFEDRMLMITRLLRDLRSCCLQTESPFSERLSCTDTHTQSQPSGTLLGIPSSIHPVTETLFAAAIAIQTGNPLIFFFSDSAFQISARTASLVRDAAIAAGAPDNCIQWLEIADDSLLEKCNHCPDISGLILSGLSANIRKVFSAFSAECILSFPQPAFCYIHYSADPTLAAGQIVLSKTFDNGMCLNGEQIICADAVILPPLKDALRRTGGYFASPEEIVRLTAILANLSDNTVNPSVIGQSTQALADLAGIVIPEATRLIILEIEPDNASHPLLLPFLCPVLVLISVNDYEQAADKIRLLSTKSASFSTDFPFSDTRPLPTHHYLALYAADNAPISFLSYALPDFSIIENAPAASVSMIQQYMDIYGHLLPSSAIPQLFSIRRCHSTMIETARCFSFPAEIYYGQNPLEQLKLYEHEDHLLFLQCPAFSESAVQTVIKRIQQKYPFIQYECLKLAPDDSQITDFLCQHSLFPELPAAPDCLIVIGDSTAVHIAKMLMTRYQQSASSSLPRLIIMTSDAGCHAALLPFYPHYDSCSNRLTDMSCRLSYFTLIADSHFSFFRSHKHLISACMAAMADAFDSLLFVGGDDISDAMAFRSIQLFLVWLPLFLSASSERGHQKNRPDACLEHLQNACILSGLACSHTGLGLSHILSQQLCCEFRISMSALQALLIPRLLLYYGSDSTHLSGKAWTVSSSACSADNYLKMLAAINPSFDGNRRAADILAEKIDTLLDDAHLPTNIKSCHIREKDYLQRIEDLALRSFEQLSAICADAGSGYPLVSEIVRILKDIY